MDGEITIDISGLKELERVLGQAAEGVKDHLMTDTGALIRELLSTQAKNLAPVRTGTLRQMIQTAADGDATKDGDTVSNYIKSGASYSIFVEYGTGFRGDPAIPHTTKRVWFQPNPEYQPGRWTPENPPFIMRFPQKPQPFMRPALNDSVEEVKDIIKGDIGSVFEL